MCGQLPNEEDALITVANNEDMENMLEESEREEASTAEAASVP